MKPRVFFIALTFILILATFFRFYRLDYPKTYFFDEVYHALTAKLISRGDPRAYEWWNDPVEPNTAVDWLHPPLAKYTQAISMKIFGENSFGWRFSSAFFGVLVIAITALIAQIYFKDKKVTLLAALLTGFDGMLLTQSRIAMNDIHVTFFILATIATYGIFRRKLKLKYLFLTGIFAGLACGSKWSGIYVLLAVGLAEFIRILQSQKKIKPRLKLVFSNILFLIVIPALIYVLSYAHMFIQGKSLICFGSQIQQGQCYCSQDSSTWVRILSTIDPTHKAQFEALEARGGCKRLISHFSELHQQIWWYQTHLNATHPYQSRPWQWALDLRPVWQHVDYTESDSGAIANIYNVGNPLLYWTGLISVALAVVYFFTNKKARSWTLGFLIFCYAIVWMPWQFSPRIMFFYHYAPAVPIMSIITALMLVRISSKYKSSRLIITSLVIGIELVFLMLYPLNTGLHMNPGYFEAVFKLFPFWK